MDHHSSGFHKASRSPSKRSKTKSKVWNKVVQMTHKSKRGVNDAHSGLHGVATGETGGAACLPNDNMDVDDTPSTNSSTTTSKQFSDWSSSCESLYHNGPSSDESHFVCKSCNSGNVVFQPCVKPSLVRSALGPCVESYKQKKSSGKKGKGRTVKRKSHYSSEEDRSSLEESFGGIQVDSGSNSEDCHCPSCCSCQSNFRSQVYKSWPRKYDCPLKTFVIGQVNRSSDKRDVTTSFFLSQPLLKCYQIPLKCGIAVQITVVLYQRSHRVVAVHVN